MIKYYRLKYNVIINTFLTIVLIIITFKNLLLITTTTFYFNDIVIIYLLAYMLIVSLVNYIYKNNVIEIKIKKRVSLPTHFKQKTN